MFTRKMTSFPIKFEGFGVRLDFLDEPLRLPSGSFRGEFLGDKQAMLPLGELVQQFFLGSYGLGG